MNYFWSQIFRDRRFWTMIGLGVAGVLVLFDFLSYSWAPPGYFNLWLVKIAGVAGVVALIGYGAVLFRRDRENRRVAVLLPAFITERRRIIADRIAADPDFQTFCYKCAHYDNGRRACCLRLGERVMWIKVDPGRSFSHCLYWNVTDRPEMLKNVRRLLNI